MFICLESTRSDQTFVQCLSSKVMHWDEGIWLIDLSPTLSYWKSLAKLKETELVPLLRDIRSEERRVGKEC